MVLMIDSIGPSWIVDRAAIRPATRGRVRRRVRGSPALLIRQPSPTPDPGSQSARRCRVAVALTGCLGWRVDDDALELCRSGEEICAELGEEICAELGEGLAEFADAGCGELAAVLVLEQSSTTLPTRPLTRATRARSSRSRSITGSSPPAAVPSAAPAGPLRRTTRSGRRSPRRTAD
jgi:hypothetical protein